jgi:hypothetical protein
LSCNCLSTDDDINNTLVSVQQQSAGIMEWSRSIEENRDFEHNLPGRQPSSKRCQLQTKSETNTTIC